jgi:LmbE family N-acetylglucosaminyl deacetylase
MTRTDPALTPWPRRSLLPGVPGRTLLGVWAHPDDEAYLAAGLMAAAVDAGCRVVVATATRGEAGADDPGTAVGEQRARELAASLAAVGVSDHRWLGGAATFRDGALDRVPDDEGVAAVAWLLADVSPDLVVTFGPEGLTGHADHRAVSRWVTQAWERSGERATLWYATLPPGFLDRWGTLSAQHGIWMDGPPQPVDPADLAHLQAFTGSLLDRKYAALAAHTSQTAALIERVGAERYRQWWSTEAFVAAPALATEEVA